MIEVMVTLTIMGILMVLFTTGILQVYTAENRVESATYGQGQVVTAFQRLDRTVRYASGISQPAVYSGDAYVEWVTTNTGTAVCTELRLHTANQQLQMRTWNQGMSPLVPSAWKPLAAQITPKTLPLSATSPFNLSNANASFDYERLEILITATSGRNNNKQPKSSDVTFTALNTSHSTSSTTVCTEGRVVP